MYANSSFLYVFVLQASNASVKELVMLKAA
jgi:hypothetical protein